MTPTYGKPDFNPFLVRCFIDLVAFSVTSVCLIVLCFVRRPRVIIIAAGFGLAVLVAGYCLVAPLNRTIDADAAEMAVGFVVFFGFAGSAVLLFITSVVALTVGLIRWRIARERRLAGGQVAR